MGLLEPEYQNSQACHQSHPRLKEPLRCLPQTPRGFLLRGKGVGITTLPLSPLPPPTFPPHTHTHRHPGQSCRETKGRGLGGAGCGGGARPARSMRRETRSLRAPAKGAGVRTLAAARTLSNINKGTPPSPWCSGLEEDCGWAEVCEGGCGIWLCRVSGCHASCVLPIVERVGSTL